MVECCFFFRSYWRSALEADASTIASIFGFIANVTSILLNFTALIQGIKDRIDFQHFYSTGVGILDTEKYGINHAMVVHRVHANIAHITVAKPTINGIDEREKKK